MIISTQNELADYNITETIGIVRGSSVRARAIGRDVVAGLRTIFGGEVREYSELVGQSRQQAVERMIEEARGQGADAIVAMRFVSSTVGQGISEILAYGTAVKAKKRA